MRKNNLEDELQHTVAGCLSRRLNALVDSGRTLRRLCLPMRLDPGRQRIDAAEAFGRDLVIGQPGP